ncbi:hypothetical protein WJX79_007182 [Trebouxia sp. C0005]
MLVESSSTYRRLERNLKALAHQFPEEGQRVVKCVEDAFWVRPSGERVDGRCTPQTELQLLKSDREEHAHRSVGRLLRAGTDYKFIDGTSRAVCVESYKMLLGPFFPEYGLPSFGGRQLQRRVALTDIDEWFHKPTNQNLEVREDLSQMLSQNGLCWPPMLESMSSCAAYSLRPRGSAFGRPITYADDAGMLHSTHNFEIATFTIESDMQELLQDDTQLGRPPGNLNNELNQCIGDEPLGHLDLPEDWCLVSADDLAQFCQT